MLASVAHSTRYAGSRDATFTPDPIRREFHLAIAHAPAGYWSARKAAFANPDQGEVYSELVIESLGFAKSEIEDFRVQMSDSSDIHDTTIRALECLSAVLGHCADWLGHRDGLGESAVFAGNDLPRRLKEHGLDRWLELFGRDLEACYPADGGLSIERVTNLSPHVERLLWSLGIYCWPEDDNVRCIVTDQPFVPPTSFQ